MSNSYLIATLDRYREVNARIVPNGAGKRANEAIAQLRADMVVKSFIERNV
jgi:hypothetical protein